MMSLCPTRPGRPGAHNAHRFPFTNRKVFGPAFVLARLESLELRFVQLDPRTAIERTIRRRRLVPVGVARCHATKLHTHRRAVNTGLPSRFVTKDLKYRLEIYTLYNALYIFYAL